MMTSIELYNKHNALLEIYTFARLRESAYGTVVQNLE